MQLRHHRRAFTLLEIFVVLGIVALLLALLVPFFMRMREGGRSGQCVQNMQRIGKAILAYANEHEGRLPGPLTVDQYPAVSAGSPPRDGQLLKHIATYISKTAAVGEESADVTKTFIFPAWHRNSERTTDAPVFLINNGNVQPFEQPAWGTAPVAPTAGKPPLTLDQLKQWTRAVGTKQEIVPPGRIWALTEADQEISKILGIKSDFVPKMPGRALHMNHRNALYFDWHVDTLAIQSAN